MRTARTMPWPSEASIWSRIEFLVAIQPNTLAATIAAAVVAAQSSAMLARSGSLFTSASRST